MQTYLNTNGNGHSALQAKYLERTISKSPEIADYVNRLGKLYSYCYLQAKEILAFDNEATTADYISVAEGFFVQAIQHFDL